MVEHVAVVTGGDKGVGFAIVKGLCKKYEDYKYDSDKRYNGHVYLTACDVTRGLDAVSKLVERGLKPKFHQLDVTDDESVTKFRDYLQNQYGGLDILVNNAAIGYKMDSTEPFEVQAEETIRVNYFSVRRVCTALYPLLRPYARMVNFSGYAGRLNHLNNSALEKKLSDPNLTEEGLDDIMRGFVLAAKSGTHKQAGWPNSAYIASKIGVSALAGIHQSMFNANNREDIAVNAVNPDYVDADMTSDKYKLTPDNAALAPVFAAFLMKNTHIKGNTFDCIQFHPPEVRARYPDQGFQRSPSPDPFHYMKKE